MSKHLRLFRDLIFITALLLPLKTMAGLSFGDYMAFGNMEGVSVSIDTNLGGIASGIVSANDAIYKKHGVRLYCIADGTRVDVPMLRQYLDRMIQLRPNSA